MLERQRLHKLCFIKSAQPRPQEGDWRYHDGVTFRVDQNNPASEITLRQGTFILVRCEKAPRVMQVLSILEKKRNGEARLRTRSGVLPAGLAAPGKLSHARARYPRQVFWQVDGGQYYSGDPDKGTLQWRHVLAVCSVVHRRSLTAESMQAYEEPLRNFGHRSQQGLLSTQRFFYSKSLDDRQCFRIEDFCLPCDEQYKIAPIQKQGPLVMMDVCCGVGGVTMGANILNEAVRQGAKRESTHEDRQINVEYAIERHEKVWNAYLENAHQGNVWARCSQKIKHNITVEQCLEGMKQQAKGGMKPWYGTAPGKGGVDILHMSPPCQAMSKVNMHANVATIKKEMVPLLDQCVEMLRELEPRFVTVEEVPAFLIHKVKKEDTEGSQEQEVRGIWRILLPLLDMGYQVDMRILNAAHFAVPQSRLRLILWAAKAGYVLPTPPTPWTHYEGKKAGVQHDSALRMRMQWNDLSVTSDAAHAKKPLPPAFSARDAIHDLPLHVEAGCGTHKFDYITHVEEPSVLVNSLRPNKKGLLHSNWMPGAASNTEKCLKKAKDRSCYDKPFPTICGSTSHHAAHNLCPRPGANRLITVAERKRFQSFPDHACLEGSVTMQMQQVGNAVPPLLAWAILGSVFSAAYGVEAPKPHFVLDMQRAETEAAARAAEDERDTTQSLQNLVEHVKKLATLEDRHALCLGAEARDRYRAIRSVLHTQTSPRVEDPPVASAAHPQMRKQPRPAIPASSLRKLPRVGERRNAHRAARPCESVRHDEQAVPSGAVAACSLLGTPVSAPHDMAAAAEASADAHVAAADMARESARASPELPVHGTAVTCMGAADDMAAAADEAADLHEAGDVHMTDAHEEAAAASPDRAVLVSNVLAALQMEAAALPVGECGSEADVSAAAADVVLAIAEDLRQDTARVEAVAGSGVGSSTATRDSRGQKRKATDIPDSDPDEEAEEFDARAHVTRGMAVLLRTNDDSDIGWDKVWSVARVNRHDKKKGKLNVTWLKPASLADLWEQQWRDWTVEMTNKKGQTYKGIWSSQVDIDTVQWGTRMQPDGFFQERDREIFRAEVGRMEAVTDVLPT